MRLVTVLLMALAAGPAAAQSARSVPSGCQEDFSTCKEDCSIEYGGSGRTIKQLTQCLSECQENRANCADRHSALRGLPPGVVADEPRPRKRPSGKKVDREEDPFGDSDSSHRPTNRDEDPFGDGQPESRSIRAGHRNANRSDDIPPPLDTGRTREEASPTPRDAAPVDTSPPPPPVSRQGVYRASQAATEEPAPAPTPSPTAATDLGDLEPLDAPPPAAPTAAARASTKSDSSGPTQKPAPVAASVTDEKDPLLGGDDDAPAPEPVKPPPPTVTAKKPAPPPPSSSTRPSIPPEPKDDISVWDPNGD
ncbi:hypothetical protein LY474_36635 [Myxococcus stipitatus]|uniref:hypothetical protein n=1 Tax=Myxococcus stipitatus TaxID=83455 RepID=UPI001F1CD890|nr:hypothetical protein [Myxococcus stipitatus]MCE9673351.1 hypothetical protein [Myxococcus stipitatus]